MGSPRPAHRYLATLTWTLSSFFFLSPPTLASIQIQASGSWTVAVSPPGAAGRDVNESIESDALSMMLQIDQNPGGWLPNGKGWRVTVSRSGDWHPNLRLRIKRTTGGTPPGCLVGATDFLEVPDSDHPVEFFECNSQNEISSIGYQLQIQGVSVLVGPLNQTTLRFTVVEF